MMMYIVDCIHPLKVAAIIFVTRWSCLSPETGHAEHTHCFRADVERNVAYTRSQISFFLRDENQKEFNYFCSIVIPSTIALVGTFEVTSLPIN